MGAQQTKSPGPIEKSKDNFVAWDSKEDLLEGHNSVVDEVGDDGDDGDRGGWIVLYDFEGTSEEHLKLKKGERIEVVMVNGGGDWSWVKKGENLAGWAPSNYLAPVTSLDKFSWYHGQVSRSTSEYLLRSGICGCFLVRESESCKGQWSISMRFEGDVFHYRINKDAEGLFITEDIKFPTLPLLIHHYSQDRGGLVTCLQFPVVRKNKPSIYNYCPTSTADHWEINRMEIQMEQKLGSGQYGDVYEALWITWSRRVAVKTLKTSTSDSEEFLKEVGVMKEIKHPHLLQLLGVCSKEAPFYIITEFMVNGSLLDFLHCATLQDLTHTTLLYMASQIVSAMVYLEEMNFIHRDLAARNCLVGEEHLVKVADFGLARFVTEAAYEAQEGSKFPIRWTAPEGLAYSLFTTKSDVWAFGILLHELATLGTSPYPEVPITDIYTYLEKGYRMEKPHNCPQAVYDIMLTCWKWSSEDRPSFKQLHQSLDNLSQHNLKPVSLEQKKLKGNSNNYKSDLNNNNTENKNTNNSNNKPNIKPVIRSKNPQNKEKSNQTKPNNNLINNSNKQLNQNSAHQPTKLPTPQTPKPLFNQQSKNTINQSLLKPANTTTTQPSTKTNTQNQTKTPPIKPTSKNTLPTTKFCTTLKPPTTTTTKPLTTTATKPLTTTKPSTTATKSPTNTALSDSVLSGSVANIREQFSNKLSASSFDPSSKPNAPSSAAPLKTMSKNPLFQNSIPKILPGKTLNTAAKTKDTTNHLTSPNSTTPSKIFPALPAKPKTS